MTAPVSRQPSYPAGVLRDCVVQRFSYGSDEFPLVIPESVYSPDTWTCELLAGLYEYLGLGLQPSLIVEIGVGSGVVPICIDRWVTEPAEVRYIGMDASVMACEAARLNLEVNGVSLPYSLVPGGSLLSRLPPELAGTVDLIVANIPQMPSLASSDTINAYYLLRDTADAQVSHFDLCGLGLVYDMLVQARQALSPTGAVLFTLAGRCTVSTIDRLFLACTMAYRFLRTTRVLHPLSVSIDCLKYGETDRNIPYSFFLSPESHQGFGAVEAGSFIATGQPVYHDLHVVLAWPSSHGAQSRVVPSLGWYPVSLGAQSRLVNSGFPRAALRRAAPALPPLPPKRSKS